jgi:nucleoside-diphosphate-sugar epimerase
LYADRSDHSALRAALSDRDFDCIYDISAYRLEDVELMTELFRGRTGHYIFASSTVIYAATDLLPIGEGHPVDRSDRQNEYALNKLLCEDHLIREHRERGFPASVAAFSMVFGPRNILPDREQRMFIRLTQGRKVLIPGDGTTLGQVGHVDDEARALRMMMGQPVTFGKRYNLTGRDCFSDVGYVDTCAETVGLAAEDVQKVFIPAALMDDLYAGRVRLGGGAVKAHADIRTKRRDERAAYLFQIQRIIQRIAPHIHHWNKSVLFSTERLRQDVGWAPEYSFPAAVEQTWQWMQAEGLDRSLEFDFGFEDELIERIESS